MTTKHEHSYGVIPLQKKQGIWSVLLVQLHAGHWGFPKGHPDPHETPKQTAERELFEETGLSISQWISEQTFDETYFFKFHGQLIHKKVTYFMAEVAGVEKMMEEEIKALKWVSLEQAESAVSFDQARLMCQKALSIVRSNPSF